MDIYLLRHGQAEAQISTDEARNLTPKGRADVAQVMGACASKLMSIAQIWASPLVRAQQTAEIAKTFCANLPIQTSELLVPEANPQAVFEWLDELRVQLPHNSNGGVLLVSHLPLVGELASQLCGKPEGFYPMSTSTLAVIRTDIVASGLGELVWIHHAS